jgi:hypothetical protein
MVDIALDNVQQLQEQCDAYIDEHKLGTDSKCETRGSSEDTSPNDFETPAPLSGAWQKLVDSSQAMNLPLTQSAVR